MTPSAKISTSFLKRNIYISGLDMYFKRVKKGEKDETKVD